MIQCIREAFYYNDDIENNFCLLYIDNLIRDSKYQNDL